MQAKASGQNAVALTDHNTMYGTMEFLLRAQKEGLRPIIGLECDVQLEDEPITVPMILYAKDNQGLQALYRLSTLITTRKSLDLPFDALKKDGAHLLLAIAGLSSEMEQYAERNDQEQLAAMLQKLLHLNGEVYIGIAMNDSPRLRQDNRVLKTVAHSLGMETFALSRIDYLKEEDWRTSLLLAAIDRQETISNPVLRQQVRSGRFWRSKQQMEELYDPDDLEMTEIIADQLQVDGHLPKASLPSCREDDQISDGEFLEKLCKKGLLKRLNNQVPEIYARRLDHELDIILSMGFASYFLIVWDFIKTARSRNILVGPGRGSAAGSLVSWCLGITHIDPIKNDLLFERFLNPSRITMPDIDTDFPDDRRDEIIRYVTEKYGRMRASHIVTFSTFKSRMVLRDAGKAMNVPVRQISELSAMIPAAQNITLEQMRESHPEFARKIASSKPLQDLYEMAVRIEGLPRHESIHAGGIVISDRDITDVAPLVQLGDAQMAVQFTMGYLEDLGLIKFDFLGLRNLGMLAEMLDQIRTLYGRSIDLFKLPLNDPDVYHLLRQADTLGVFQLESSGIRHLLKEFQPERFEDIAAVLALYRPGPMKNINLYLEARRHPEKRRSINPIIDPLLDETGGIFLYQEQIMLAAQKLAGFSLAQADSLRKAMSKKKKEEMESYRQRFVDGAKKTGVIEAEALSIFETIERFADYGFNKSHSYAYALVVYWMAWMKVRYPGVFYIAALNSVLGNDAKMKQYLRELESRRLRVLAPSLSHACMKASLEPSGIRLPLTLIKGMPSGVAQKICQESAKRQPITSFRDAVICLQESGAKKDHILAMIDAGALDELNLGRKALREGVDEALNWVHVCRSASQPGLYDYEVMSYREPIRQKEDRLEIYQRETKVMGFSLQPHPARLIARRCGRTQTIDQILSRNIRDVRLVGQIEKITPITTRNHQAMAFLQLSDGNGTIDAAMMPDLWAREQANLKIGDFVLITGVHDRPNSVRVRQISVESAA